MKNDRDFDISMNLYTAVNNLPSDETINMEIWTKCYLTRKSNYIDVPSEYATNDYKQVVDQVIDDLSGFKVDKPIKITETITMHFLLLSMNYNISLITDYNDGLIQTDAFHMVERNNRITLFFIRKELQSF